MPRGPDSAVLLWSPGLDTGSLGLAPLDQRRVSYRDPMATRTGTHDHAADPRNDEILIWVNGG